MRHIRIGKELNSYLHKRRTHTHYDPPIRHQPSQSKITPQNKEHIECINTSTNTTTDSNSVAKEVGSMDNSNENSAELRNDESQDQTAGSGKKKGFFGTIKSWFSPEKDSSDVKEYDDATDKIEESSFEKGDAQNIVVSDDEVKKDLVSSMKISLVLMQKIPEQDLEKFKRSSEFQTYKNLLTKYKIKKL